MEAVRDFLESSSINGLNHIANSSKLVKLFWILIVAQGFVISTYLIYESFENWEENPVRTTVSTAPISELKFPTVTVCPPRNTFTDMNYDLIAAENKTLSKETKQELFEYVIELIEENIFLDNLNKFHEKDRFHNWYYGLTRLMEYDRSWDESFESASYKIYRFDIETSATSGVVTTEHFGEDFQPELVEHNVIYQFYLWTPESVWDNPNVTLHLDLEKVSLLELSDKDSVDDVKVHGRVIPPEMTTFNFTSRKGYGPGSSRFPTYGVSLERYLRYENLDLMNQEKMPGFRLKWYYSGSEFSLHPNDTFLNVFRAHEEFVR